MNYNPYMITFSSYISNFFYKVANFDKNLMI